MEERFYTPQDIAEMLKVSLQTVRLWYRTGKLECYKMGRVRISESQLQRFIDSRQRAATPAAAEVQDPEQDGASDTGRQFIEDPEQLTITGDIKKAISDEKKR